MRIFKFLLFTSFLFNQSIYGKAQEIEEQVYSIQALMYESPDSAIQLAEKLKIVSKKEGNDFGVVKCNFILGYIHDAFKSNYGKAIIYYLEALRKAENASYANIDLDKSIINLNSAVIFRKFKSYDLSYEYNINALDLAKKNNYQSQVEDVMYNLSRLYVDQKNFNLAISTLRDLVNDIDYSSNQYWKFMNRLGNAYHENQEYSNAITAHLEALNQESDLSDKSIGYSYHNIARSYVELGDYTNAEKYFKMAIGLKISSVNLSSLYSSYKELGEMYHSQNKMKEAFICYNKAEGLMAEVSDITLKYELFKSVADAYYESRKYDVAKKYENLHSEYLNKYITLQNEIKDSEMNTNIELITKRYFDEVEKQESIASILLVSKLTSGSLLVLLLIVIGYNRHEKLRLRKTIKKELIALRIID